MSELGCRLAGKILLEDFEVSQPRVQRQGHGNELQQHFQNFSDELSAPFTQGSSSAGSEQPQSQVAPSPVAVCPK